MSIRPSFLPLMLLMASLMASDMVFSRPPLRERIFWWHIAATAACGSSSVASASITALVKRRFSAFFRTIPAYSSTLALVGVISMHCSR